jgi:hypothetical protein
VPEPAEARRAVVLTMKVSASLAARVDAARGTMPRMRWLEQAVTAFLDSGAAIPALLPDPEQAARLAAAMRGSAEAQARLAKAMSRPLQRRCAHRKRGCYCDKCRYLVDADGFPVRL